MPEPPEDPDPEPDELELEDEVEAAGVAELLLSDEPLPLSEEDEEAVEELVVEEPLSLLSASLADPKVPADRLSVL